MRSGLILTSFLSALTLATETRATETLATETSFLGAQEGPSYAEDSIQYAPPTIERRGGFAMALTAGYGVGNYRGFPLEVAALNDPAARVNTGASFANNLSLWLGGSPRDWITAGIGISLMSTRFNETLGSTAALLFHLEGFPLFHLGGTFVDLGIGFDGGLGAAFVVAADDEKMEDLLAESGALSTLGLSVFWEPIRLWHLSMGPALNYTHAFSQTMNVDQITLGFRTALYGVMPKKDK